MKIFLGLLTLYLLIGVAMNFFGPISRMIWVEEMKSLTQDKISNRKRFLLISMIRLGVVFLYPLFFIKI
jgi:hypothetical protein